MNLRQYQLDLVRDIRAAYASGYRSVCAVAPTGAGKSLCFKEIAELAAAKNKSVCVAVHRDTLLRQASEKMDLTGVKYGIIAAGYRPRPQELIQIASVQTLIRRMDDYNFHFLIFDEAQMSCAPTYGRIKARWPTAHVLGFTATPVLSGGRGLSVGGYQKLVLGPTTPYLISDGFLTSPVTFGPIRKVDISGVRTRAGDYSIEDLERVVDTKEITGDVIKEVLKICPGVPTMIFCTTRKHAADVAAQFKAAGLNAESVDGSMPRQEIRRRIDGLSNGKITYLASCDLLGIGFDAPAVTCAVFLRHTKSLGLYIQQAGRALRPLYAPGFDLATRSGRLAAIAAGPKPKAYLIDHVGSFILHDLADSDREWSLDGSKKRKKGESNAIALRQCPQCAHTHRTAPKCPRCGWVYILAAKENPDVVSGELTEIDKVALKRAKWKEVAQARTIDALRVLGKSRGYHHYWADRIMEERARKASGRATEGEFFS